MPYHWTEPTDIAPAQLTLWPHRSLTRRGFVVFIGTTAALLALPLLTQVGTLGLWMLLPFLLAALSALWLAIQRSYQDGQIVEELQMTATEIHLSQRRPGKPPRTWAGNPYWVRPVIYPQGGRVPNYLTLKGTDREVELGAFLDPDERLALKAELETRLAGLRSPQTLSP